MFLKTSEDFSFQLLLEILSSTFVQCIFQADRNFKSK